MDAPYSCQAILMAYDIGTDREAVALLHGVLTTADSPSLQFFQTAAFKLQQVGLLSYVAAPIERRFITTKGRQFARQVRGELVYRFGQLEPRELIARLAPDCLREINAWQAEGRAAVRAAELLRQEMRHG